MKRKTSFFSRAAEEILDTFQTDEAIQQVAELATGTPEQANPEDVEAQAENVENSEEAQAANAEGGDDAGGEGGEGDADAPAPGADGTGEGAADGEDPKPVLSEEETAKVDADTETAVAEGSEADAPTEEQATEAIDELAAQFTTLDEAQAVAGDFEAAAAGVEQSIPAGGLQKVDAAPLETALTSLYENIGQDLPTALSFGEESFRPSQRAKTAKLAAETLRQTATRVWKAIMDFIKRLVEWVDGKFKSMIGGVKKVAYDIKMLEGQLANFADHTNEAEATKEMAERLVSRSGAALGQRWPTEVNSGIMTYGVVAKDFFNSLENARLRVEHVVNQAFDGLAAPGTRSSFFTKDKLLSPTWVSRNVIPGFVTPDGLEAFTLGSLPGGLQFGAFVLPDSTAAKTPIFEVASCKIFLFKKEGFVAPTDLKYLNNKAGITAALGHLKTLNEIFTTALTDIARANVSKRKLLDRAAKMDREAGDDNRRNEVNGAHLKNEVSAMIKALAGIYDHPVMALQSNYSGFARTVVEYLSTSIKNGIQTPAAANP